MIELYRKTVTIKDGSQSTLTAHLKESKPNFFRVSGIVPVFDLRDREWKLLDFGHWWKNSELSVMSPDRTGRNRFNTSLKRRYDKRHWVKVKSDFMHVFGRREFVLWYLDFQSLCISIPMYSQYSENIQASMIYEITKHLLGDKYEVRIGRGILEDYGRRKIS